MTAILSTTQKEIDAIAQKRLSPLYPEAAPFQISCCITSFRTKLSSQNLIADYIEDEGEIMHSGKIVMDMDTYFQYPFELSKFVANYMGTKPIYVINRATNEDGLIFVGQASNVYATQVLFDALVKMGAVIRAQYMEKLKRYKKQSTKDDKADDYMSDWLDSLTEDGYYSRWLDFQDDDMLSNYIRQNFKTTEDERQVLLAGYEMIQELHHIISNDPDGLVDCREVLFKKYPKEMAENTSALLTALQTQDLVLVSPDYDSEEDEEE